MVHSEEPNAQANIDRDGTKLITFTSGLYTYLDYLIASEVMSREFNAHKCGVHYAAELVGTIKQNMLQEQARLASVEILAPEFYAARHPDICRGFWTEQLLFVTNGGKWSAQYQQAMGDCLRFVMLHEFAHLKHGDVEHSRSPEWTMKVAREQEAAADDFALSFFVENNAAPLTALPVMALIAQLQNFPTIESDQDNHPLTLDRVKAMFRASNRIIKSRKFQEWLKTSGPDEVKYAEQFLELLSAVLD